MKNLEFRLLLVVERLEEGIILLYKMRRQPAQNAWQVRWGDVQRECWDRVRHPDSFHAQSVRAALVTNRLHNCQACGAVPDSLAAFSASCCAMASKRARVLQVGSSSTRWSRRCKI